MLPMQRARGEGRPRELTEFGEKVFFQPMTKHAVADKLDARWQCGTMPCCEGRGDAANQRPTLPGARGDRAHEDRRALSMHRRGRESEGEGGKGPRGT